VSQTAQLGQSGTSTVFISGWQFPIACNVMLDFTLDIFTIAMIYDDEKKNNNNNGDNQNNSRYESQKLN
jgi:hypothetical protein